MNTNTEREELARTVAIALCDVAGIYETSEQEDREIADAVLAAGYRKSPKIRASDDALRTRLTDLLLAYKGTPRHELFEYPHRDSDSRAMIREAEAMALNIIHTLNSPEATR